MEQDLECPICLQPAQDAVESDCCHQVFCVQCAMPEQLGVPCPHPCPVCRQNPVTFTESHLARRLISSLPCDCPYGCDDKLTLGNVEDHKNMCDHRLFECPRSGCQFSGIRIDFLTHIIDVHSSSVLDSFLTYDEKAKGSGKQDVEESESESDFDCIGDEVNSLGFEARLGSTGLYYCGRKHSTCCDAIGCCDGRCGPTNGCNCASCQELTIRKRKLPRGWFVNREGCAVRKSEELLWQGNFYCGRCVLFGTAGCDGWCGPDDGPNCPSCQKIGRDVEPGGRYFEIT